jgi:FtsZ-interacting cell division protein YlmF
VKSFLSTTWSGTERQALSEVTSIVLMGPRGYSNLQEILQILCIEKMMPVKGEIDKILM